MVVLLRLAYILLTNLAIVEFLCQPLPNHLVMIAHVLSTVLYPFGMSAMVKKIIANLIFELKVLTKRWKSVNNHFPFLQTFFFSSKEFQKYLPHFVAKDPTYHISIVSLPVLSLQFAYLLRVAPSYCLMQPHHLSIMSKLLLLLRPMTLIPSQYRCQHTLLHHLNE